jgi:hypothetical protein
MKKDLGNNIMTQQKFNEQLLKIVKPKGWFLTFLLTKLLPFLWKHKDELADVFRKKQISVSKSMTSPTCNKNDPNDPNYGKSGNYDSDCVWHPWVIQE